MDQRRITMKKHKKQKQAPDWFGCGRVITQESWDGFLAAQKEYWEIKDAIKKMEQSLFRDARDNP